VEVEHGHETAAGAALRSCFAAEHLAEHAAQSAALPCLTCLRRGRAALPTEVAGSKHRDHRQHALEQCGIETGSPRGILRDGAADILRTEDLAEHIVAEIHMRRLRTENIVHQTVAA